MDNLKDSVNSKTTKGQLIWTVWQPEPGALSDRRARLQLQSAGSVPAQNDWQQKSFFLGLDCLNTENLIRKIFPLHSDLTLLYQVILQVETL